MVLRMSKQERQDTPQVRVSGFGFRVLGLELRCWHQSAVSVVKRPLRHGFISVTKPLPVT